MSQPEAASTKELAYYYPNPMWSDGNWIKNLLLFFDGIALLVPDYMRDKPRIVDPAIVAGLEQHKLLHIIEPADAVDKTATAALADALQPLIESGVLDALSHDDTSAFHALSMSRLGFYGDSTIAGGILEALQKRNLAGPTQDGVSIPMHPYVRILILVILAQILRSYGDKLGAELSPATDFQDFVDALGELLSAQPKPSTGTVVQFDVAAVTVDLGPIPIDEVLGYRQQNLAAHRLYATSVRRFANELSRLDAREREDAFAMRQAELDTLAADLRAQSRRAWKKPASFALGLAGAAVSLAHGNPLGAALSVGGAIAGYQSSKPKITGAYSYLFNAGRRFGR